MNKYKQQAEKFLSDTNTKLEVVKAIPQKSPLWTEKGEQHGINYWITLTNKQHIYGFNFWGSIADAKKIRHGEGRGTKPNAYDVLACLSGSTGIGSFEDFCGHFGYDDDSIRVEKIYKAVLNESENINKLWNSKELETLAEIN